MAKYTSKLNLKKPEANDFYNVNDSNENFDKIDEFASRTDNPHNVTKAQVGLGNVDNTSDKDKPISTAQATAINEAKSIATSAKTSADIHATSRNNPHNVTVSQLGAVPELLGNSATDRIIFLLGDHRRLTNHVDASVPNLPIESNYMHMYTISNGIVKTCLSIPIDYGIDAYYYTAYDKRWRKIADASKFLPLVGGVISGSTLGMGSGHGQVYCNDNTINIFSMDAPNKNAGRYLGVYNNKNAVHDSVILTELAESGTHNSYRIYGEHNLPHPSQIQTGSYDGNGNTGSKNAIILPFNFNPKIVFISGGARTVSLVSPNAKGVGFAENAATAFAMNVSWGEKSVSFYNDSTSAGLMMNASSTVYNWVAIG